MKSTGIAAVEEPRVVDAVAVVEEVRRQCIPSSHRPAIAEASKLPHHHYYSLLSADPPPAAVDADDVAAVSGPSAIGIIRNDILFFYLAPLPPSL